MSAPYDARGLPAEYELNPEWEIAPAEVKRLLETGGDCVLIDCRTTEEHAIARIGGAVCVPLEEIPSRLEDLREHEDRQVVVHCHRGIRSLRATAFLRQVGFSDVKSMAGGIDAWAVAIDPSVPRY